MDCLVIGEIISIYFGFYCEFKIRARGIFLKGGFLFKFYELASQMPFFLIFGICDAKMEKNGRNRTHSKKYRSTKK